jgi:hypothetical protein
MRTLDERNRASFSFLARCIRDLKLVARLAGMTLAYFTAGARIRRRYRRSAARGETYWLDDP